MSDSNGGEPRQHKIGAVIDLVTARTHRETKAKAKNNKKTAPEKPTGLGLGLGLGSNGGGRRHGSTKGSANQNPPATSTLFKVARILQFIVIFAGTAYLLRTCGYL